MNNLQNEKSSTLSILIDTIQRSRETSVIIPGAGIESMLMKVTIIGLLSKNVTRFVYSGSNNRCEGKEKCISVFTELNPHNKHSSKPFHEMVYLCQPCTYLELSLHTYQ